MPTKRSLKTFYANFSYDTGFINEKLIRNESRLVLKYLNDYKGTLLDIGSGAGFLVDEAQKMGWDSTGVEMSKKLVEYGKSSFKLKAIHGDFIKVNFKNKKFNVIVLSQVIEHIIDPKPLLKKILYLLHKNGILHIATPNIESHSATILKKNFPYLIPPEHVYFYSPQSLSILLNQVGFKITNLRTYGYRQDMSGIIKQVLIGNSNSSSINKQTTDVPQTVKEYPSSPTKLIKYIIFDRIFCTLTYRLLNLFNKGSMLSIYATKMKILT